MAVPIDEAILNALRGHVSDECKLPVPRTVKIYVASVKHGKFFSYSVFAQYKTGIY